MTRVSGMKGQRREQPQDSTTEPLDLVIGFSAGSASDDLANLIAPALGRQLQRPVTIKRIQGEDGGRAARAVAAGSDGNTLLMVTLGTHALRPHFEPHPGYDPLAQFTPISLLVRGPMILATGASSPYRSLDDVLSACRENPGRCTFAASAAVGAPFLATELFRRAADISINNVVYDRTTDLYADLEAGRVDFSFNNLMSMQPRIRRGELCPLALTSPGRFALLPDVMSLSEAGMQECVVFNWLGLMASRNLSAGQADGMSAAVRQALASAEIAAALDDAGLEAAPCRPADFRKFIQDEIERWAFIADAVARGVSSPSDLSSSREVR
ncbi:Bug family tripartite tricarboxylate transporter substrate binding protein [Pseudochelatococcus sp. B33]